MLSLVNSKDLQIKLFIISLVFFGVLAYLLPTSLIDTDYGNVILTIATFLLGIFAGFLKNQQLPQVPFLLHPLRLHP